MEGLAELCHTQDYKKIKYFKNNMPIKMTQEKSSKYEDDLKIKGIGRFHPYIIYVLLKIHLGGFTYMSKETIGKHAATCDRVVQFFWLF